LVAKKLSTFLKVKYRPNIISRDGKNCFYCGGSFDNKFFQKLYSAKSEEFDHLNDDDTDNRPENLVLSHRVCNQHKRSNNSWIIKAKKKLRENTMMLHIPESHLGSDKETPTEIDTNAIFADIVKKELEEKLLPHGDHPPVESELIVSDFLNLVSVLVICFMLYL